MLGRNVLAKRGLSALAVAAMVLMSGCSPASETSPTQPEPAGVDAGPKLMTPADLFALPKTEPDFRIAYGADPSQAGELRIPEGAEPHPVVVLIHGGCWKAAYGGMDQLGPLGDALKAEGIATWNIEYRRLGQPGGNWPGVHLDVGNAIDHLRTLSGQHKLDLDRVVFVGHSAGGNLAMWAAGRSRLKPDSNIYMANPLIPKGVINLAGGMDLTANIELNAKTCGEDVGAGILGGTPDQVPRHYADASPIKLVPLGVPQVLIWGDHEDNVPTPLAEAYVATATAAGDRVKMLTVKDAGHFETASPASAAWPIVLGAIKSLLAETGAGRQ